MKIGGDLGIMKKAAGGRRAATLSPEDLADLCRSLTKISTGKGSSKSSARQSKSSITPVDDDEEDDFDSNSSSSTSRLSEANTETDAPTNISGKRKSQKRIGGGSNESSSVISYKPVIRSIGPLTRVLMLRGYHQVFRDVSN